MKTVAILTIISGLAAPFAAAAPAPAPDTSLSDGFIVKTYLNGLPAGLYPGSGHVSRATNLERRQSITVTNEPGVTIQTFDPAGVFVCSEANFLGTCIYFRSLPGQCVNVDSNNGGPQLGPSSLGPEDPWVCRFFAGQNCDATHGAFTLGWPGNPDLSAIGFDNIILSFRC